MPVCEALTIDERSQDGRLGEVYAFVGAVDLGRVRLRDNRGAFSTHRVLARQAALSRRVVAARSVETAASVCRGSTEFVRSGARDVPFNHDSHRSAGCHGRPAVAGGRRRNREIFAGASARPSSCLGRNAPSPTASILCVPNPRVRLLGYPAAERIGIDLPKFVAEGVEHLPLGIERTNPAGQLFAMFDVH